MLKHGRHSVALVSEEGGLPGVILAQSCEADQLVIKNQSPTQWGELTLGVGQCQGGCSVSLRPMPTGVAGSNNSRNSVSDQYWFWVVFSVWIKTAARISENRTSFSKKQVRGGRGRHSGA